MARESSVPEAAGSDSNMRVDAYLDRIGLSPDAVDTPDLETLERLQRAHVGTVPFENLSIVGDPYSEREGEGVTLSVPHCYRKVVDRERGGYCFELNGVFHWLLGELGYDVDRIAARVMSSDGASPPANHHTNIVQLDQRYVVEVGTGVPMLRFPLPLDGASRTDEAGIEWRVAESERPDATYCTQYREAGETKWNTRYVFSDIPRDLGYFEATNDYLQTAPESPFVGDPVVAIATEDGHRKLSRNSLTETAGPEERQHAVDRGDWHDLLEREFGLRYRRE